MVAKKRRSFIAAAWKKVAAKEVNRLDFGAVSKNVPPLVKADAVIVHPVPWPHIRGWDHGRNIGPTGVVDIIEPENIQKKK